MVDSRTQRSPARYAAAVGLFAVLGLAVIGVIVAVQGIVEARHRQVRGPAALQVLDAQEARSIRASSDARALWDQGAARAFGDYLERELPGTPSEFFEITLFGDYAFVIARDPDEPSGVLQGEWRGGELLLFRSLSLGPGSLPPSFGIGDVPWSRLEELMDAAADRLEVKDPDVRYLQIDGGADSSNGVVLHFFVNSAVDEGGVLVADKSGAITGVLRGTQAMSAP